ncbi:MAG TPA: hypothetical protein DEA44_15520 [Firmicutes bacterium]|nr:hypothetical protein [Bacillota bacterium]HWR56342.1 hypothetical protein [Negativicutes bacterium]
MFLLNARGEMEYLGGKEDWDNAARIAAACAAFREDDEAEQIADEAQSCYNCRYRRWTRAAFACCKGGQVPRG